MVLWKYVGILLMLLLLLLLLSLLLILLLLLLLLLFLLLLNQQSKKNKNETLFKKSRENYCFLWEIISFSGFFWKRWNRNEISKITETKITRTIKTLIIKVHWEYSSRSSGCTKKQTKQFPSAIRSAFKNFVIFTRKPQFSYEYCDILKNTYFEDICERLLLKLYVVQFHNFYEGLINNKYLVNKWLTNYFLILWSSTNKKPKNMGS